MVIEFELNSQDAVPLGTDDNKRVGDESISCWCVNVMNIQLMWEAQRWAANNKLRWTLLNDKQKKKNSKRNGERERLWNQTCCLSVATSLTVYQLCVPICWAKEPKYIHTGASAKNVIYFERRRKKRKKKKKKKKIKKEKKKKKKQKMHLRAPPTWNLYLSGAKGTVASNLCYIAFIVLALYRIIFISFLFFFFGRSPPPPYYIVIKKNKIKTDRLYWWPSADYYYEKI